MAGATRRVKQSFGLLGNESGQALVIAFILMLALTISIAGVISYTTSHETQTDRDRSGNRAFHVAEAGLNDAAAVVSKSDTNGDFYSSGSRLPDSNPAHFYTIDSTLDGASGQYYMQKYSSSDPQCTAEIDVPGPCWVIYSTATSADHRVTRSLTETIYYHSTAVPQNNLFNYGLIVFNQPGQGCGSAETHGNTAITLNSIWVSGDFCTTGNASVLPATANQGSIYIGGTYYSNGGSSIGTQAAPFQSQDIVGGCQTNKVQYCFDSANSNVWAAQPPAADPSTLEKPTIDGLSVYNSADWHNPTCKTVADGIQYTGYSKFTFDSDTSMNGTTPTTTLMPDSSKKFDCSTAAGSLKWDGTTLTISGKIFIDGDVSFSQSGNYVGNGTIYVNGVADGPNGTVLICGPMGSGTPPWSPNCGGIWNSSAGSLGVVIINPNNSAKGFDRQGNGEIDVTLLVNQGYTDTGTTIIAGSVMADTADVGGSSGLYAPSVPPDGFPTTVTTSAAWVVQPGSWRQTQ